MKSEYRVLVFTLNLMIVVPALYALGDWWAGMTAAIALPAVATLASFAWMKLSDRKAVARTAGQAQPASGAAPNTQPPPSPPTGAQPPVAPSAGV